MSFTTYFSLSQFQYLVLAVFGGVLLFLVLAIAYWSYRLGLARHDTDAAKAAAEFNDGLQEGHHPVPLFHIILTAVVLLWGILYVLAVMRGWLDVQ